jgi:hypothetical protein
LLREGDFPAQYLVLLDERLPLKSVRLVAVNLLSFLPNQAGDEPSVVAQDHRPDILGTYPFITRQLFEHLKRAA